MQPEDRTGIVVHLPTPEKRTDVVVRLTILCTCAAGERGKGPRRGLEKLHMRTRFGVLEESRGKR